MRASSGDHNTHEYPAPRGNVLVLSCMDLRVVDDVVHFMNRNNLINRYDHFILAGSALGAIKKPSWNRAFFEHLELACDLHSIRDVYILEHRHCGAYEKLLGLEKGHFDDSAEEQARELAVHRDYAFKLADRILAWAEARKRVLHVRCFLVDLRGDTLYLPPERLARAKVSRARRRD